MSARYYISPVIVKSITRGTVTRRIQLAGVEDVANANGLAVSTSSVIPTDPVTGHNATSWAFSLVAGRETAHDVLRVASGVYELAGIVADEPSMDAVTARLRSVTFDALPLQKQTEWTTRCATVGELGPFAGQTLADCCNVLLRRLGLRGADADVTRLRVVF